MSENHSIIQKANIAKLVKEIGKMATVPEIFEEATGLYRCDMVDYSFYFKEDGLTELKDLLDKEGYKIEWDIEDE